MESLLCSLKDGSSRPNLVRRVEIAKGNGEMCLLGIPTVVDLMIQQAINQVLTLIYKPISTVIALASALSVDAMMHYEERNK